MSSLAKRKGRLSPRTLSRPNPVRVRGLHKHPYVEVAFVIEGSARITVGDEERDVQAGGIAVIPANTPHQFVNSGDGILRQIDIHASPNFIQTDL